MLPPSGSESPLSTRSRAMGSLNHAIQRRLSTDPSRPPPNPTPLSLAGPPSDLPLPIRLRPAHASYISHPLLDSDPSSSSSLPTPSHIPSVSHLSHSQYLAARRHSMLQRRGLHRRVVSESLLSDSPPQPTPQPQSTSLLSEPLPTSAPPTATLPSLDQIRNWAAQRRSLSSSSISSARSIIIFPLDHSGPLSFQPDRPLTALPYVAATRHLNSQNPHHPLGPLKKSRSLRIYSHARDPSIPQICLSPDSDDEDEPEVQSDTDQLTIVTRAKPDLATVQPEYRRPQTAPDCSTQRHTAHLCSGQPAPLSLLQEKSNSQQNAPNRAERRQFLLNNLAQAKQRRSAQIERPAIFVAPV